MKYQHFFNPIWLSLLLILSVPAKSDSLPKSFRALVNFGELLVIQGHHAGVKVRTSDRDLPIEMIFDPSAPLVKQLETHAESEDFIYEDILKKFNEMAANNMGFVLADVLSSSATTCKKRITAYGDPYYFFETIKTFRFSIPIADYPNLPVVMISHVKTTAFTDFCDR